MPKKQMKLTSFFEMKNPDEGCKKVPDAKSHWTNLRDMFRRDVQKCLRKAKETGDPNVPEPRWRHFKPMLFLKDHITKDEMIHSIQFVDACQLYPQVILEDISGAKAGNGSLNEEESTSTPGHAIKTIVPTPAKKRVKDSREEQYQTPNKRLHSDDHSNDLEDYDDFDDYNTRCVNEMDEDYHFLMSILPSVRRVKQDRKTSFKMKVLQLIMEEEIVEST